MTAHTARRWPAEVPVHPAAELFPLMAGESFAELVEDIRANGLVEPIIRTPDDHILDGRNRLLACAEANKPARFVIYGGDPWTFVISTNLHRRHLTDTQRAIIAGKLADREPGRLPEKASDEAFSEPPPTRAEVAQLLQVSRTALERARRVQHTGTEALNALTESGKVPLSTADRVAATMAPEEQDEFVRKVNAGMSPRAAAPAEEERKARHEAAGGRPDVSAGRRKRARPARNASVIGSDALAQLAADMSGYELALKAVTAIDPTANDADRAAWERAITKGIRALSRLRKLIKEKDEGEQP